MKLRVYLCEDNEVFARELASRLPRIGDVEVLGHAACAEEALADARLEEADVLLLDLEMPGNGGLWAIDQLMQRPRTPEILVLTSTEADEVVFTAIRKGAAGYLLKGAGLRKILQAIEDVALGGCVIDAQLAARFWNLFIASRGAMGNSWNLTSEEIELLNFMARGLSNPELAGAMGRKRTNIKKMLSRIYRKMNVTSRVEAVRLAMQSGLVEL